MQMRFLILPAALVAAAAACALRAEPTPQPLAAPSAVRWTVVPLVPSVNSNTSQAILLDSQTGETWVLNNGNSWSKMGR